MGVTDSEHERPCFCFTSPCTAYWGESQIHLTSYLEPSQYLFLLHLPSSCNNKIVVIIIISSAHSITIVLGSNPAALCSSGWCGQMTPQPRAGFPGLGKASGKTGHPGSLQRSDGLTTLIAQSSAWHTVDALTWVLEGKWGFPGSRIKLGA